MNKRTKRKGEKKYLRSKSKSHIRRKSQKSMRRKSMRRKSMKRGGLIGATCDKYRRYIKNYDKITNIDVNKKRYRGLIDFMIFDVVIYPYLTRLIDEWTSRKRTVAEKNAPLEIEAISVYRVQLLQKKLLKINHLAFEDLKKYDISRILLSSEKNCKKLFENVNGFFRTLESICHRNTISWGDENRPHVQILVDTLTEMRVAGNWYNKKSE